MKSFPNKMEKTELNNVEDERSESNASVVFCLRSKDSVAKLSHYIRELRYFIMTTRFNNATWEENCHYRSLYPKFGCIYCSPSPVTSLVHTDATMFILEMNNDENRIMGIGMVKNHPRVGGGLLVYSNSNYNRYQFYGKTRIDRENMTIEEEAIMRVFDILCFTGNMHQKRGHGLSLFPLKMLFRCKNRLDLVEFLAEMFRRRRQ